MLMECYECGKQISTRAERCTNCGFPVAETDFTKYCNVNGILYNFSEILKLLPKVGDNPTDISPIYIAGLISDKTYLESKECDRLVEIIRGLNGIPESYEGKIDIYLKIGRTGKQ